MTSVLVREFKCQVGVSWSTSWIMWHKCIHMRAESRGKEPLLWPAWRSALWEGKHAADGSFSFVCTATAGDPLGNASLLNWGASNASLEQRRKSVLPNASQSNFYILCNGNCENGIDVTNTNQFKSDWWSAKNSSHAKYFQCSDRPAVTKMLSSCLEGLVIRFLLNIYWN